MILNKKIYSVDIDIDIDVNFNMIFDKFFLSKHTDNRLTCNMIFCLVNIFGRQNNLITLILSSLPPFRLMIILYYKQNQLLLEHRFMEHLYMLLMLKMSF